MSAKTIEYTVVSSIDGQEYGSFKTVKEAREHIKDLKRFDKEQGNPFDEGYRIIREEFEYGE